MSNLSIKFKVLFNVVLTLIIVSLMIILLNYRNANKELVSSTEYEFVQFKELFNSNSINETNNLKIILDSILNDKDVLNLFENGKREDLLNYLYPFFQEHLFKNGIEQFHFHTKNSISF